MSFFPPLNKLYSVVFHDIISALITEVEPGQSGAENPPHSGAGGPGG